MSEFGPIDYSKLMYCPGEYKAVGFTYPLRDDLISWGWHWDICRKIWVIDADSLEDLAIKAMVKKGLKVELI
jgi:hypothetical protein